MPRSLATALTIAALVLLSVTALGMLHISALAERNREFKRCLNDWNEPLCRSIVYGDDMPKRIDMRRAN